MSGGKSYFKYELEKETGSMTWRTIPSTENGTVFYEADLVARLHKVTTAQRNFERRALMRLAFLVEHQRKADQLRHIKLRGELVELRTHLI